MSGSVNDIIDQMSQSEAGSHDIVIHPNTETFRKLYSGYVKRQLKDGNQIVVILPYYETTHKVREILSESIGDIPKGDDKNDSYDDIRNSEISKYEKEGSLVIEDSVKIYSSGPDGNYDNDTAWNLIQGLVKRAENSGKDGVSVIADLGSFYHHLGDTQTLVDYELSLPPRYDDMKKGFCVYHKEDFDKRLTEEQKEKLLDRHGKVFMVEDGSSR
jgi:MEDS: MEthanogen/methylotroph, DcmR Sensory domain